MTSTIFSRKMGGQFLVLAFLAVLPLCAQTATIQVCKTAGTGVTAGTNFGFTVNGTNISVAAGSCTNTAVTAGAVSVTEAAVANTSLTSITSTGTLTTQNLLTRTATLSVAAGTTTTVTFTNFGTTSAGGLRICKVAGSGVTAGTTFNFTVLGTGVNQPVAVPAGTCSVTLPLTPGATVTVHEAASGTTTVSAITGGTTTDLATGTATALISGDAPVTVTYTNIATATGTQGCSPGYFKNHLSGSLATTTVGTYFAGLPPSLSGETLVEALQGGGGPGLLGAETILLRAAVAAMLNALNPNVKYAYTTTQITTMVNAAIASGDRATILALAAKLDAANNGAGGCPLSGDSTTVVV